MTMTTANNGPDLVPREFQNAPLEGPFGHKTHRDDPMRPHFEGFESLSREEQAAILKVRDGEVTDLVVRLPNEEIFVQHHGVDWYDGETKFSWGYTIRRRPLAETRTERPSPVTSRPLPSSQPDELLRVRQELFRTTDERDRLRVALEAVNHQLNDAQDEARRAADEARAAREECNRLRAGLKGAEVAAEQARADAKAGESLKSAEAKLARQRRELEEREKALEAQRADVAGREAQLAETKRGFDEKVRELVVTQDLIKDERKRLASERTRQELEAERLARWESELNDREKSREGVIEFAVPQRKAARRASAVPSPATAFAPTMGDEVEGPGGERYAFVRLVTIYFLVSLLICQCIYLAAKLV
jgi:hypothetical protein